MKSHASLSLLAIFCLFAVVASAADVTGTWKAQRPGRDGSTREVTIVLKADGANLTGTVSGPGGRETQITNGKVSGDDITFTVVNNRNGNEMKTIYTGKVAGSEIKFVSQREGSDRKQEFTAKKS